MSARRAQAAGAATEGPTPTTSAPPPLDLDPGHITRGHPHGESAGVEHESGGTTLLAAPMSTPSRPAHDEVGHTKESGGTTLLAAPMARPSRPAHDEVGHTKESGGTTLLAAPMARPSRPAHDEVGHTNTDPHCRRADGYLALRALTEAFEDAQRMRIAVENRVGRAPIDPAMIEPHVERLRATERGIALVARRVMRANVDPRILAWQKATIGIGEHLLARLLGRIGHPRWATVHAWEGEGAGRHLVVVETRQRRVSDLWSYCGHGDPARKARRGMSAEEAAALGDPRAKMIVRLLAEACVKQRRSPYRLVYDERRAKASERVHAVPCVRCGPSGKPAPDGSPWSLAHQHADALRIVGKEILRDLWTVAS